MTLIRKLALALSLALLSASYSNSQDISTTGNLINYSTSPTGTTSTWNNGVYVNQLCFYAGEPGNCGPNPSIRPGGYINFSYGTADLNQVININTALSAGGTGVQLAGFTYNFMAKNGNGWDDARQDYLAAYVKLYGSGGNLIANYDYSAATNNKYNWTNFNFNETFANPYVASTLSTAQVGMIGRDNNFWAGNYGPEVYNVDFRLKYKVDPCATNPAYSSTCAGFGNVVNTNNLLDSTQGGSYLNQAFAINTALQSAGVGATIHGFNYGFNWRVGQGFFGCTAWNQDGSCSWMMNTPAYANATVSLTNNSNQSLYSKQYSFSGDGTSGSVSDKFLLPSSLNQSLLGTGRIVGSASGTGSSIEGAWATMIYTADPCVANPLYSPDCKGYAIAIAKQLAPPTSSTTTTDGTQTTAMDPTTGMSASDPTKPPPPPGSQPPPGSEPPPGSQPPPPGATQTASSNPASTPANQPPPQGGSSQPKAGEVKTAGDNKSSSPVSLSSVMSMISSNQTRIGNEAKSVVQAAESAAAQSATSAQQQAESVAGALTAQSISSSMTQSNTGTGLTVTASSQSLSSVVNVASVSQTSVVNIGGLRPATQSVFADPSVSLSSNMIQGQFDMYSLQAPPGLNNKQPDVEVPQNEGIKVGGRSALNDVIEQRPVMLNATTQEQKTDSVNRNVQPNELAGRVDIASIATQPQGYQAYAVAMPDANFYAPREIYRNQVNVDNVRLLRGLASDKLHQDLVNLQYK
jgi:hypothetical protein